MGLVLWCVKDVIFVDQGSNPITDGFFYLPPPTDCP